MTPLVDEDRLSREIAALAGISDESVADRSGDDARAVTRIVFTDKDLAARTYVRDLAAAAGLAVRVDEVGNMFARWTGSDPALAPVATGSHIDAIPNAGRFDGTVGVLGGLEAIRALSAAGFRPARSIELIVFTSEEPTRFGVGCLGSRLLSGALDESAGARLRDREGRSLDEVRTEAGFRGPLSAVRVREGAYRAFVELHIEQGPLLEQRGIPLGVVSAIAAPSALTIAIEGEGGHAGAVLMPDRRDAFLAAAEIALAVEAAARATGSPDTVATVGVCEVFPGAVNSVPSRARIEVDVRDIDAARRDGVLKAIGSACEEVAARRRVTVARAIVNADPPARCDPEVVGVLCDACEGGGWRFERMISRAYHDSLFMSRVAPTGMLFIPCRGGVSHRPDEYAAPGDIARGAAVLADALARLSSG